VTELQCAGQDKRDTVGCEVVHWFQMLKDMCQYGRGGYMLMDHTSYKIVEI